MGAAVEVTVLCETSTDVWTDLTPDVMASDGLNISYGIAGDKPMDTVAGTGQCSFTLLGLEYSFHHADALSGFEFGAPIRVIFHRASDGNESPAPEFAALSVATLELRFAGIVPPTHSYEVGEWFTISGLDQSVYNQTLRITSIDGSSIYFKLGASGHPSPTGTPQIRKAYCKHNGKLRSADPTPGAYRPHTVSVSSYDGIRELAETKVRAIDVAINKSESELLTLMLDSLSAKAIPSDAYRDFATGVDTYPYAFNELGTGTVALSVIKSIAVSGFATVFMKGDGTLVLQSRHTRSTGSSQFHFNESMTGLTTAANVGELENNVRTTINPRTVDALATTVIASTTGTPLSVEAGDTLTIYLEYRDPTDAQTLIGGTAVVNATATTDYLGNATIDGTGSNLTSSLTITTTAYASTAKLAIANGHLTDTIYLVDADGEAFLQLRGKGIYQKSPQSFEAISTQAYGDKMLTIDLKYQSSTTNAQSYALVVEENYNSQLRAALETLTFDGNASDDLLLQALAREPGEIVSITESTIGAAQVDMVIQSISLNVTKGPWVTCTYGLAPATTFAMWILGNATRSKLGDTTVLGF